MGKILITGGCGYIGSHTVRQLSEQADEVVVLDDLSTGFRSSLLHNEKLYIGSTGDGLILDQIFRENQIEEVIHFAASIVVPESVANPVKYYQNNLSNSLVLLNKCKEYGVKRFIFSSTAAVYGESCPSPVLETYPVAPTNPYGWSKFFTEQIIQDVAKVTSMSFVILRYFNVAGADPKGRIGQKFPNATHLIKVASEVAVGARPSLTIFGTDYQTRDGTGVRDYIHVEDLAAAHLSSLVYLRQGGRSEIFNCGYGVGFSVREVVEMVNTVCGHDIAYSEGPRRPGDVGELVANNSKIKQTLAWQIKYANLKEIVASALNWEKINRSSSKET